MCHKIAGWGINMIRMRRQQLIYSVGFQGLEMFYKM